MILVQDIELHLSVGHLNGLKRFMGVTKIVRVTIGKNKIKLGHSLWIKTKSNWRISTGKNKLTHLP